MKTTGFLFALSVLLAGCAPESDTSEDGGGANGGASLGDDAGNGSGASGSVGGSTSGRLIITEENQDAIIARTFTDVATDSEVKNPFETFSGTLVTGETDSTKALMSRAAETLHCDSGSASVTTAGDDIGSGAEPADGSSSFTATYNDCIMSSSGGGFTMSMHIDGTINANMEWMGYEAASNTFNNFAIDISMENFYFSMDQNGRTTTIENDFSVAIKLDGSTVTQTYSGTTAMEELGDGDLAVEVTAPLITHYHDVPAYPVSGEVKVSGGDGTSIEFSVVAGGVEVSVNGGQEELYTWPEVDSMARANLH